MFIIGIELGAPSQFTAISIVEPLVWHSEHGWTSETELTPTEQGEVFRRPERFGRFQWVDERDSPIWVRDVQRFPLGTPYPEIFNKVADFFRDHRFRGSSVIVDRSAVGREIVDELGRGDGVPYVETVRLTAGGGVNRADGGYNVPKTDVAAVLRVLLDKGLLRFGPIEYRNTLVQELLNFSPTVKSGVDPLALDWREGERDDLVLAVGIAAWYARRNGGRVQTDYEILQAFDWRS